MRLTANLELLVAVWVVANAEVIHDRHHLRHGQPDLLRKLLRAEALEANLIALRLFQHDLKVFFVIQGRLLRDTLRYLRHSIVPMSIIMLPVIAILIQLHLRYEARPLRVGEEALVKVRVADAALLLATNAITLRARAGVAIETGGMRLPETQEVAWRIRAREPGRFELEVKAGEWSAGKQVVVGPPMDAVPTRRTGENWWTLLLYPGEPPLPAAAPVRSIEITCPSLELRVLGRDIHWLVQFFVLSILFGYLGKGWLRVEI